MQTISRADEEAVELDARVLLDLLRTMGRVRPLRDPLLAGLEEHGVTPAQVHSLLWLWRDGALPMGEIARRLGVSEKTVTGLVDRLERQKHVSRERDEADRRVVRVKLSRAGAALAKKLDERLHQSVGRLLVMLDPPDRKALLKIFQKLCARVSALASPEP